MYVAMFAKIPKNTRTRMQQSFNMFVDSAIIKHQVHSEANKTKELCIVRIMNTISTKWWIFSSEIH